MIKWAVEVLQWEGLEAAGGNLPQLSGYGQNENKNSYSAGAQARKDFLNKLATEQGASAEVKNWFTSQTNNNFWMNEARGSSPQDLIRNGDGGRLKYRIRDDIQTHKTLKSRFANSNPSSGALTTLAGSPKQVSWASSIREGVLKTFDESSKAYRGNKVKTQQIKRTRAKLASETSSRFWIDNFKGGVNRSTIDYIIHSGL